MEWRSDHENNNNNNNKKLVGKPCTKESQISDSSDYFRPLKEILVVRVAVELNWYNSSE